ncbi:MAG: glycosyltransferase [Perlucidibaca sp.]
MKRVAILLATYNGERWLDEQLDSLLNQTGVAVTVFVSDDCSGDGTIARLQARADERIRLLPATSRQGSAAGNFFRLLRDVDFSGYDAISLSDQDDIWHADKLARALTLMAEQGVDAVSGNVTAFWPDGRRRLIRKSQPQQAWDHFFEAAGPGCTYVLSPALATSLQQVLRAQLERLRGVSLHDWFIYCHARTHGFRWYIDERPVMDYRQHGGNVIGANQGLAAARARLARIMDGWYRDQIVLIADLCGQGQEQPVVWLRRERAMSLLPLLRHVGRMRRYWRDRLFLAVTFILLAVGKG